MSTSTERPQKAKLLYETDWLGSKPVFYNERTGAVSRQINDVIDFANVAFDPEGLAAYLGSGFCVYQHTPILDVRCMPPSARLWRGPDGGLRLEEVELELDERLARRYREEEVMDLLIAKVQSAAVRRGGELVIPTSGGYDSRLLNLAVEEPATIRSFTFGTSACQEDSIEVTRARVLAGSLGNRWECIAIGDFHDYLDEWDNIFGPATHAHGMYQMEFYRQVRDRVSPSSLVLSGLLGDRFEGSADRFIRPVKGPADVARLIRTFGQHADPSMSRLPWRGELCEEYYETHRDAVATHPRRVIENARFRLGLLHYLVRVPEHYGFSVSAPFTNIDVATAMLTLPAERRLDRLWVRDFLRARGALFEDTPGDESYSLYCPALRRRPLEPLDVSRLSEVIKPEYVSWINRTVGPLGVWHEWYSAASYRPGLRRAAGFLRTRGIRPRRLEAYHAYMTLRPIQRLIQKRDAACRGELLAQPQKGARVHL